MVWEAGARLCSDVCVWSPFGSASSPGSRREARAPLPPVCAPGLLPLQHPLPRLGPPPVGSDRGGGAGRAGGPGGRGLAASQERVPGAVRGPDRAALHLETVRR